MNIVTKKQLNTRKKYSQSGISNTKILICTLSLTIISLAFVFNNSLVKAKNSIDDISAMLSPIQINLKNYITSNLQINDKNVTIDKIASYTIAGRVVESFDYSSNMATFLETLSCKDYYSDIAIKDIAIAYGPMALEENHQKMTYYMTGTRRVSYAVSDSSIYKTVGDIDTIKNYITNNHLIASNLKVEELIKKISKDDYVQISGYLVNVSWYDNGYTYSLNTSTKRTDLGLGACEVIYVEDVKWVK